MKDKVKNAVEFYIEKFTRKSNLLNKLTDKIANGEELTVTENEQKNILVAEVSLIKKFIEELDYIQE